jgi:hypothetical protein
VGDHHHGHAVLGKAAHDVQHLAHHLGVQGGGGLVEKQHLGLHGQRPGDGHALLLAAGYLPGLGVNVGRHAHAVEIAQGVFSGVGLAALSTLVWPTMQLSSTVMFCEKVEGLEHHAHLGAVGGFVYAAGGDVLAVEKYLAGGGRLQEVYAPQQGGLAGAGGADDAGHVARRTLKSMSRSTSLVPKALERC